MSTLRPELILKRNVKQTMEKITGTLALEWKWGHSWEKGTFGKALCSKALVAVPTTYNNHYFSGSTSPLYHWPLQRHQNKQNSTYASIWAKISRTLLEWVQAVSPCLFLIPEVLSVIITPHNHRITESMSTTEIGISGLHSHIHDHMTPQIFQWHPKETYQIRCKYSFEVT